MAIDQTDKQRDLVTRAVQYAGQLQDLLEALAMWNAQREQAGTFTDDSFVGNVHVDATDITTLATRFGEVRAVIEQPFYADILSKARR